MDAVIGFRRNVTSRFTSVHLAVLAFATVRRAAEALHWLTRPRSRRGRWRRRVEGSILLAVLGMAALATTVGVPPLSPSGTIGASSIPLGDYAGWTNASGIAAFGATTGTHPTLATDYLD